MTMHKQHRTGASTGALIRRGLSLGACVLAAAVGSTISVSSVSAAPPQAPIKAWSASHGAVATFERVQELGGQPTTWYGPGFFGRRTACGQRLRSGTWGIAHRTLPCGTLVHLGLRGRTVVVPVVDRGPYSGATIDLTQRTARHLRFTNVGRGIVSAAVVRRTARQ